VLLVVVVVVVVGVATALLVVVLAVAVKYTGPDLAMCLPLSCNISGSNLPLLSLILRNLK